MGTPSTRRERRFFLDPSATSPQLAEEEIHHAVHVNRLKVGDSLWGLDGQGQAHRMRVTQLGRRQVALEALDEVQTQPRPGEPGADLVWIELGISLPKYSKLEPMVDRLTQLGAACLQPIVCEHSPPHARETNAARWKKLERTVREAMKQSGRLWPMELREPLDLRDWLDSKSSATSVFLHPGKHAVLPEVLQAHPAGQPILLGIGPEAGFTESELEGLNLTNLRGPILRTETAAELAAGMAAQSTRAT